MDKEKFYWYYRPLPHKIPRTMNFDIANLETPRLTGRTYLLSYSTVAFPSGFTSIMQL